MYMSYSLTHTHWLTYTFSYSTLTLLCTTPATRTLSPLSLSVRSLFSTLLHARSLPVDQDITALKSIWQCNTAMSGTHIFL